MYLVSLSDKVLYEVARGVPLAGPDPESAWSGASVVGGVVGGILLGVVAAFAFVAWRRKAKAGEGRGKGRVAAGHPESINYSSIVTSLITTSSTGTSW